MARNTELLRMQLIQELGIDKVRMIEDNLNRYKAGEITKEQLFAENERIRTI